MLTLDAFAHVRDAKLRGLAAYWLDLRRGERLPEYGDLDPARFASLLPYVWVSEREGSGRFRYHLAGERINEVYGRSLRGRYLDEIMPAERREKTHAIYARVVDEPAVLHNLGWLYNRLGRSGYGERLALPMRKGPGPARIILGVSLYVLDERPGRPRSGLSGAADTFIPVP